MATIKTRPAVKTAPAGGKEQTPPLKIHIISHNHWDREWIFTAKYTNRWLPLFFDNLFKMLAEQPAYRFVLDGQTLIIEDYLSQLPVEEAGRREQELSKYVKAGRLLIGPAYLQPDWGLVSGEALVRNLMIGHDMAQRLGGVMKAGWMLDNFGQVAQAPQIYRGFGIEGVFVWRGIAMEPEELTSEFWWESPDGSKILAIYLINSYRNAMTLSLTKEIAKERVISEAKALLPFATTPNVLLMNGYEQVPWPDDVLPIIEEVNQALNGDMTCLQSTPPDYLEAVNRFTPRLPTLRGYLYSGRYMPVLKGVFSSRSHLKLLNNECQRELERWAEPFAALAWTMGTKYPEAKLITAWKTLLLNHTHDDMCGCSVDTIVRDMEERFEAVYTIARDISDESLRSITERIDTSRLPGLVAIVIFNPSPRERQDVLGMTLTLPNEVTGSFTLRDSQGRPAPYQIVSREGQKVGLYLYVDDIPALGYETFYLVSGAEPVAAHPAVIASAETRTLENDHLKVEINQDGSLNVTHKETGQTYQNLAYFEDGGDAGDTYDYSYPATDKVISSLGRPAQITLVESGPLVATFKVVITLDLPEALTADRQARSETTRSYPIISYIELSAGCRRVEIKTTVHNAVKDHRLRLLFPTGLQADYCHAEEPFDVAQLPVIAESALTELPQQMQALMIAGRYTAPVNTHPFQNFVDYNDGEKGLAITSRRVTEYEVIPENGTIALTLLRSVGWLARYDLLTRVGDVGPHIFTPEAQCLGKQEFHYAIYPHRGERAHEKAHNQAFSHNLKLRAIQTSLHAGNLPNRLSFLSLSTGESNAFRISALKRAEAGDGLIVRFFNTRDEPVEGELETWFQQALQVFRTNLNEEEQAAINGANGKVRLQARPKEIVTLKFKLNTHLRTNVRHHTDATWLLPPLPQNDEAAPVTPLPVITEEEVQRELDRVEQLAAELLQAKADVFTIEDEIERTASRDIARLSALQRKKTEVATLTRQLNESRISALVNRQLFVTNQIESELAEIGEAMSWSRTKKRAGEYLVHYYDGLLRQEQAKPEDKP